MWSSHPSLHNKIKEWWGIEVDGTTMYKVAKKLRFIKLEICKWNKLDFGNIFQDKERILGYLAEVQNDIQTWGYDDKFLNSKKEILVELHNIVGKEEMF